MNELAEDAAVTAIVPAYNAEATLDETLRSIRSQTHRALEILIVDDGSRDDTPEIALRHVAADPRVRLIQQANAGVAAARNRGIAEARTALIAPVDADDLWAPTKIERQLAALRRGGGAVSLVYTWSALIDADSRVIGLSERWEKEGSVLASMCRGNFIGNGSAALMRRAAVLEAGGYDSTLLARHAQGCEDWLLYCRIAARHHYAVVQDYLTGYRQGPATMSRDTVQMRRSWKLVAAELRVRYPMLIDEIDEGENFAGRWMFARALNARRLWDALAIARMSTSRRSDVITESRRVAAESLKRQAAQWFRSSDPLKAPPPRFGIGAIDEAVADL